MCTWLYIATQYTTTPVHLCDSSKLCPQGYSLPRASSLKQPALRLLPGSDFSCTFLPCLTPQAALTPSVRPSLYLAPSPFFGTSSLKFCALLGDECASSPPPSQCFTSWEFLWKQPGNPPVIGKRQALPQWPSCGAQVCGRCVLVSGFGDL